MTKLIHPNPNLVITLTLTKTILSPNPNNCITNPIQIFTLTVSWSQVLKTEGRFEMPIHLTW